MTKKHKRKHSGELSEDSTKQKQDVQVLEVAGSEDCEVHIAESVSSTKAKSTEYVSRKKKHKKKNFDDICNSPKHTSRKTGENEISESQQIVNSQHNSKSPQVESGWSDLLSSTDACSREKSVKLTKELKRKNSNVTPDKQQRKKQKTVEKEGSESQEFDVSGYSESQRLVDSQEISESTHVESVWSDLLSSTDACSPEKSVKLTKELKRKNSTVQPDKKRKKQKTVEKESSESQELDVSGYNEPVTEAVDFDLDDILGSSAQKLIHDADSKKSVDYRTATKSYPVLSKRTDKQSSHRLSEFKGRNCVSYGTWKKVCTELEKEGKKFNSGRFSYEENEQLSKNWAKVTKSCPFEKPHVLLMKNHFPDLKNEIESYVKDTNFYARLGKHINRPLYSVYTRARKVFHPGNFKGRYTEEEVDMLKRQYREHGSQWQKIGQCMDRSGQSLNDKFKKLKTTTVFGRWSPEEDDQLREAVKRLVSENTNEEEAYFNFPWTEIARGVPTRNPKQCRDHWLNMLAFGNKGKNQFGKADKIRLIYEIMAMDVSHESEIDWIELKSKFDVPSPQFLQHKWYLLRVKVPDFQRCSLRDVLEYLESEVVPGMKALLEKKAEGDMTTVCQTDSPETSSKSNTQHEEETKGDEEEESVENALSTDDQSC